MLNKELIKLKDEIISSRVAPQGIRNSTSLNRWAYFSAKVGASLLVTGGFNEMIRKLF